MYDFPEWRFTSQKQLPELEKKNWQEERKESERIWRYAEIKRGLNVTGTKTQKRTKKLVGGKRRSNWNRTETEDLAKASLKMDAVAALKKSEGGANIQKSQSVGSLLWRSNASVNSPRTLVVRNEALSLSTYSLNWSGAQVHTAWKLSSQSEANLQEGEILAPTVCWLSLVFLVQVYAVADPELGDGCKGTWIKMWGIVFYQTGAKAPFVHQLALLVLQLNRIAEWSSVKTMVKI